jgi:hypothetical protein
MAIRSHPYSNRNNKQLPRFVSLPVKWMTCFFRTRVILRTYCTLYSTKSYFSLQVSNLCLLFDSLLGSTRYIL